MKPWNFAIQSENKDFIFKKNRFFLYNKSFVQRFSKENFRARTKMECASNLKTIKI